MIRWAEPSAWEEEVKETFFGFLRQFAESLNQAAEATRHGETSKDQEAVEVLRQLTSHTEEATPEEVGLLLQAIAPAAIATVRHYLELAGSSPPK